jgi:hypothetical protein
MTKHRCVDDDCKTKMVSFEEHRVYTAASRFTATDPFAQDIALVDPNKLTT